VFLIGGARDCDLVLGDPQFPEIHAYLFITEDGVSVRHLGAGPDLTVDGRVVHCTWLDDGARIRTGPFEFHICIEWPEHDGGRGRSGAGPHHRASLMNVTGAARADVENLLKAIRAAVYPGSTALRLPPTTQPPQDPAGTPQHVSACKAIA